MFILLITRIVPLLLLMTISYLMGKQLRQWNDALHVTPCKHIEPEIIIKVIESTDITDKDLPQCTSTSPKVYDHCITSPYIDKDYLHLAPGTVHTDYFPWLHHPASPSKWSFVITQEEDWPNNKKVTNNTLGERCKEIYLTRTGSRANQPNKCISIVKVPVGVASNNQHSHRYGYTALLTDQYLNDYSRDYSQLEENILLAPLLRDLNSILEMFVKKLGSPILPDGSRRTIVTMVANDGVMDLLLNYLCSIEQDATIDIKNIVVFVGSENMVEVVENMGANAIYSTSLGSMPSHAALGYLDKTFSRMMWFKVTSVYITLTAGFDLLFQDVDVVWFKNPIPFLKSLDMDIAFMDDGARTPRYTPFFVNSGFYYMKYNERTKYFMERMMKCGPSEIGYTHSHQSVLIRHIAESVHQIGLKIVVLDQQLFPSGEAYHEKKKFIAKIIERSFVPFVFHMCWTDNRKNKVVYFKEIKLWFLPEDSQCLKTNLMEKHAFTAKNEWVASGKSSAAPVSIRDNCCQRQLYHRINY